MNHSIKTFFQNQKRTLPSLLKLTIPILAAHWAGTAVTFLNVMLAGQYSPLSLAALGLANNSFVAAMGLGWGILTSVGILTANQLGRKESTAKTGIIFKSSFLTAALISFPIMLILKFMEPLWLFFDQSPEVARLAQNYLDGLIGVVFADLAKFSVFQFAVSHQKPQVTFFVTLASIPFIWILNKKLLVNFGLYGVGLGTTIIYWVGLLLLLLYFYYDRIFKQCLLYTASWKEYVTLVKQQFTLGFPIGAMSFIELLFFSVIGLWAGSISNEHLVAHHIAIQCLSFAIMASVGFSQAVTVLIARTRHNIDKNTEDNTLRFLSSGLVLTILFMTAFSCLYWFNPKYIIDLDLGLEHHNTHIIQLSIATLAWCGVFQIFDGIRIVLSGVLRGLSDTYYPMWITLIIFWLVGGPAAYFLTFTLNWQHHGLWLGTTLAVIVMSIFQYLRIYQRLGKLR